MRMRMRTVIGNGIGMTSENESELVNRSDGILLCAVYLLVAPKPTRILEIDANSVRQYNNPMHGTLRVTQRATNARKKTRPG